MILLQALFLLQVLLALLDMNLRRCGVAAFTAPSQHQLSLLHESRLNSNSDNNAEMGDDPKAQLLSQLDATSSSASEVRFGFGDATNTLVSNLMGNNLAHLIKTLIKRFHALMNFFVGFI